MPKIFYPLAVILVFILVLSTGGLNSPLFFLVPVSLLALVFAYFLSREVKKEEKTADTIAKDVEEILKDDDEEQKTEKLNQILEETDKLRRT